MNTLLIIAFTAGVVLYFVGKSMEPSKEQQYLNSFDFELMSEEKLKVFAFNNNIDERLKKRAQQILIEKFGYKKKED